MILALTLMVSLLGIAIYVQVAGSDRVASDWRTPGPQDGGKSAAGTRRHRTRDCHAQQYWKGEVHCIGKVRVIALAM